MARIIPATLLASQNDYGWGRSSCSIDIKSIFCLISCCLGWYVFKKATNIRQENHEKPHPPWFPWFPPWFPHPPKWLSQGAGAKAPQALEGAEFERKHGHVQGKNRCYDCYYFAIAYSHCYYCCYYIIIINNYNNYDMISYSIVMLYYY